MFENAMTGRIKISFYFAVHHSSVLSKLIETVITFTKGGGDVTAGVCLSDLW